MNIYIYVYAILALVSYISLKHVICRIERKKQKRKKTETEREKERRAFRRAFVCGSDTQRLKRPSAPANLYACQGFPVCSSDCVSFRGIRNFAQISE